MCAVRVLNDDEAEQAVNEAAASLSGSGSGERHSGGSQRQGNSGGDGRVVPHLTNPGCLVQVMPTDAVLEPG
jgi:hypothetical protein